jgi:hypothetical protein
MSRLQSLTSIKPHRVPAPRLLRLNRRQAVYDGGARGTQVAHRVSCRAKGVAPLPTELKSRSHPSRADRSPRSCRARPASAFAARARLFPRLPHILPGLDLWIGFEHRCETCDQRLPTKCRVYVGRTVVGSGGLQDGVHRGRGHRCELVVTFVHRAEPDRGASTRAARTTAKPPRTKAHAIVSRHHDRCDGVTPSPPASGTPAPAPPCG